MRVGRYEFRPALWPTLVTIAILPVLLYLGNWQLERAAWKQRLVDEDAENMQQARVPLAGVVGREGAQAFRRVSALGRYDLEHQLLLDNRIHQGRAGYHVLTPFRSGGRVVLVNRGWVPVGPDRAVLPALPGTAEEIVVNAIIAPTPDRFFRLGSEEERHTDWPRVVQQLEPGALGKLLGVELLPAVLLLEREDAYGFVREWKAVYGITPDKHRAYAMQWFTLALVLVLIYIGVNTRRHGKNADGKHDD